jgi:hypothetical protein
MRNRPNHIWASSVCEKELRQNACAQFVRWCLFRNRDREVFKPAEAPNHNL